MQIHPPFLRRTPPQKTTSNKNSMHFFSDPPILYPPTPSPITTISHHPSLLSRVRRLLQSTRNTISSRYINFPLAFVVGAALDGSSWVICTFYGRAGAVVGAHEVFDRIMTHLPGADWGGVCRWSFRSEWEQWSVYNFSFFGCDCGKYCCCREWINSLMNLSMLCIFGVSAGCICDIK